MLADVVSLLLPNPSRPGLRIVDATVGLGGHAEALLSAAAPDAELLGLDQDADALERARARLAPFAGRVHLAQRRFSQIDDALDRLGWERVDAVLCDLGISSLQLDDPRLGFSFQRDAQLDMRMDASVGESAMEMLARLDETALMGILRTLGEEPAARRIARAIVRSPKRPTTTGELREIVLRVVGGRRSRRHDPATLTFQALRLAVNQELPELETLLERLPSRLAPHARVVFLAYHSLEDRRVKQAMGRWVARCICPPEVLVCQCGGRARARALTRGAHRPAVAEIARNPRARSARLRAVEWLDGN
jgi:16S rRNA (cytosine1402-N4)-methyltransferase